MHTQWTYFIFYCNVYNETHIAFCVREATVPMNHCIYLQDLMLWGRHCSMNEKKMEKKNPTPERIDHELTSWQNQTDHDGNQWTRSEGYPGNMCSYVGIKAGWSQRDFFYHYHFALYK